MTTKKNHHPATQNHLSIAGIRDSCVVSRDGTLRAVLLVSSLNFALKSETEQDAIIAGYISFLNLLDFPLQIVIQSRRLNLEAYIKSIEEAEKKQASDLLKLQTADYRRYVLEMLELGNIMSKRFYVVVPYDPMSGQKRSFWQKAADMVSPTRLIKLNQQQFEKYSSELFVRVEKVLAGLSGMSLKAALLDTQSLIELYYNTYNPVVSAAEKMADINKLNIEEA